MNKNPQAIPPAIEMFNKLNFIVNNCKFSSLFSPDDYLDVFDPYDDYLDVFDCAMNLSKKTSIVLVSPSALTEGIFYIVFGSHFCQRQ